MIKAVVLDLNGCIFSHETRDIPASAVKAFHELKANGIKILMATGRNYDMIKHLPLHGIKWDGYVFLGGHICEDEDHNVLRELVVENPEPLIKIFNEKKYSVTIVEKEDNYINFVNDQAESALAALSSPVPPVKEYSGKPIYHAVLYISEAEEKELSKELAGFQLFRWNDFGVNVVLEDVSKVKGAQLFLDKFGISPDELMAFGDNNNDIEMLQFAKIGVALGEGTDKVKAAADYVTTGIDDDGVYNALKHYELI